MREFRSTGSRRPATRVASSDGAGSTPVPKRNRLCQTVSVVSRADAKAAAATSGDASLVTAALSPSAGFPRARKPLYARRSPRLVDLRPAVSAKRSSRLPRLFPATSPLT